MIDLRQLAHLTLAVRKFRINEFMCIDLFRRRNFPIIERALTELTSTTIAHFFYLKFGSKDLNNFVAPEGK